MSVAVSEQIKCFPTQPGVYQFKDANDVILYVGKAKNLRNRAMNYIQNRKTDYKAHILMSNSATVDYIVTDNELQALLLEAKLIQHHQPACNVLLKTGQPFLFLMVTRSELPEFVLVRTKKKKGSYFGPFIEKTHARRVHTFLINTFKLKLCKNKIPNGCLYYHLGKCAGSCRDDFDKNAYLERLELAKRSLKQGHRKFLAYLGEQIEVSNEHLEFEKSAELHRYKQAFSRVFETLSSNFSPDGALSQLVQRDIWIHNTEHNVLFLFREKNGILKRKHITYGFFGNTVNCQEYLIDYYRNNSAPATILLNFDHPEKELLTLFLTSWSAAEESMVNNPDTIRILHPKVKHEAQLLRLAHIHAEQYLQRQVELPQALKRTFKLNTAPVTIDCFDISHKQGTHMVGSCIRFNNGEPEKSSFRKFHIKTVNQIDDYASLREVVERRYREGDYPDLVLIDGGKGQRNTVRHLVPGDLISLAKREETIFCEAYPEGKKITPNTLVGQLLISMRDYAHHFAISFHRDLAKKRIVE